MKHFNVIELNQMLDMLTDFFNSMHQRQITVGGCVGTTIIKDVLDTATAFCQFEKILVIEGCNDYVMSTKIPIVNYIYYADLFAEVICDGIIPWDPFKPAIMNPKHEYRKYVDTVVLGYYDAIVISNAHQIPKEYLNMIYHNFSGKIVTIVDPFDINGEEYCGVPTIVDTLQKQSLLIATARKLYDIDTRAIEKRSKGILVQRKINRRSIGKMDECQYITDDAGFAESIRMKQYQTNLRRNHKVFVTSEHLFMYPDSIGGRRCVTANSLLIAFNTTSKPLQRFRIHSSKLLVNAEISYKLDVPAHIMRVIPANILTVPQSCYHRYHHSVFIQTTSDRRTKRYYYSLLKNSTNLTICRI
jgi:hypothetical protein